MNTQPFCEILKIREPPELAGRVFDVLPEGDFRRIMLKPNWVKHQENPDFPIRALVTSTELIDAVVEACLNRYPKVTEIIVGDIPLQNCEWDVLTKQAGITTLIQKYSRLTSPVVRFCDLRRQRFRTIAGFHEESQDGDFGDPKGYRDVILDSGSFLDPISEDRERFRVSDYVPEETISSHRKGFHRYLVSQSALDCDLFVNLPKMKTHQKTGITGALKNLVGINGEKAYLVHFRRGLRQRRGDEFPDNVPMLVVLQSRIRDLVQKRSRLLFRALRFGWLALRRLYGIEVEGTPENLRKPFYVAAGSWYGNDTVWRMVYDLNKIILYSPRQGGSLVERPQREYIAIMDGMVAGQGNGPLQPLPVELGVLLAANDPFLMDAAAARIMGFDCTKIPLLKNMSAFGGSFWGRFDPETVPVRFDGEWISGLSNLPVLRTFLPPPGWRGHVEL